MALNDIYLFYGLERLMIQNKIDRLIKESKAGEFNVSTYDMDECNVKEAIQDALTPPFLSTSKIVLIKNPLFLSSEKSNIDHQIESFLQYLKKPMDSTILIIDAGGIKLDERKEVVKVLHKHATTNESKKFTDVEFSGWLHRELSLEKIQIKDDAMKLFYQLTGNNLLNAKNEVNKLINYVGSNGIVTLDIVKKVVIKEFETDVFSLSNAIMSKDKAKIIHTYRELVELGTDVNSLIALSAKAIRDSYLVRLLLEAKNTQAEIAQKLKISSGRAFYLVKNAKGIESEKAKEYICKFADLDYKIKSGQVDARTGFEFLLFEL